MRKLSVALRKQVLEAWGAIAPEITKKVKKLENLTGTYLNIPFVAGGIPTNMACWNIKDHRFDKLLVPVLTDDGFIEIPIILEANPEELTDEQVKQKMMCDIIKQGIREAIKEELDETFNPFLGEQVADAACAKIDELMKL